MSMFHELMMRKKIPSIYKVLDWIRSTGTQYIKTGIQTGENIEINCKFMPTTVDGTYRIPCGARVTNNSNALYISYSATVGNNCYIAFGNNSETNNNTIVANNIYEYTQNKNNVTKNGTVYDYLSGHTTNFNTPLEIYCFVRNTDGTTTGFFLGRIYFLKISDNGTLVRNMIPVRRLTDNVVGMYDTITKEFKTNAGTGSFIGSDA